MTAEITSTQTKLDHINSLGSITTVVQYLQYLDGIQEEIKAGCGTMQQVTDGNDKEDSEKEAGKVLIDTGSTYEKTTIDSTDTTSRSHAGESANTNSNDIAKTKLSKDDKGTKPHKCQICGANFQTAKKLLRHHGNAHIQNKHYKCIECEYTCCNFSRLKIHVRVHMRGRPYKCSNCSYDAIDDIQLQSHMRIHTDDNQHKCDACNASFPQYNSLKVHKLFHSERGRNRVTSKSHKCNECTYQCTTLSTLEKHMKCHSGEGRHQCPHCSLTTATKSILMRHLTRHTREKPFECNICNTRFRYPESLRKHTYTRHDDKIRCGQCSSVFASTADLKVHAAQKHSIECKKCGIRLPDRSSYKLHIKSHNEKESRKYYKCQHCSYSTSFRKQLKYHVSLHTADRCLKCEHCGHLFGEKHTLIRHIRRTHKPSYVPPISCEFAHVCLMCNVSFKTRRTLMRHMTAQHAESNVQEGQQALELGTRQKLLRINGQKVSGFRILPKLGADGYTMLEPVPLNNVQEQTMLGGDQQSESIPGFDDDVKVSESAIIVPKTEIGENEDETGLGVYNAEDSKGIKLEDCNIPD